MEFQKQLQDNQANMKLSFYQNDGYQFERRDKKTFILKVLSDGTINFNETLQEPLIIDRLSDIYLESFLTFHNKIQDVGSGINESAFVLKIKEFNNQGNSSEGNTFNKIVIPHVIPISDQTEKYRKIHKSRKLNYICSMNPTTLSSLSGTITGLDVNTEMFEDGDMFLAEFVIVARD